MSDDFSRYFDKYSDSMMKNFEAVISAATSVIRLLAGINGAAMIAMLAFAGGISGKEKPVLASLDPLIFAMTYFGFGIGLSVLAAGGMYFSQFFYGLSAGSVQFSREQPYVSPTPISRTRRKFAITAHIITVIACFSSFFCFVGGIYYVITLLRGIKLVA